MAVAWRVDELAKRKGWNARELASRAGVDVKTARKILTGQATRVDLETIGRLADALGVPPGALWRRVMQRPTRGAWAKTAGVAGHATKEEMDRILRGDDSYDLSANPGLERATRDL
jgi:DNA-binding Xre family transcriptional regulator